MNSTIEVNETHSLIVTCSQVSWTASHLCVEPVVQVGAHDARGVHRGDAVSNQSAAGRGHDSHLQ